jgi:hypothetical protein
MGSWHVNSHLDESKFRRWNGVMELTRQHSTLVEDLDCERNDVGVRSDVHLFARHTGQSPKEPWISASITAQAGGASAYNRKNFFVDGSL